VRGSLIPLDASTYPRVRLVWHADFCELHGKVIAYPLPLF
jgi:hypothetical protein